MNINQQFEELNEIHGDNYYAYLAAEEYIRAFIRPMADIASQLGGRVLDIGCGEGLVGDFVSVEYVGFDGSVVAIKRAIARNPSQQYVVSRLESPPMVGQVDTLIFSGILQVLILQNRVADFVSKYTTMFGSKHIIVCDLMHFDPTPLEKLFGPSLQEIRATAEVPNLLEVKKHRKILVYKCS